MGDVLSTVVGTIVGGLISAAFLLMKVLPQKANRTEVRTIVDQHPISEQVRELQTRQDRICEGLRRVREELGGLRIDVTRLATTVELAVKKLL